MTSRRLPFSPPALLALALFASLQQAHAQGRGMREALDPAVGLARAADANGDGVLEAEEWVAFLAGLGADEEGVLDRELVKLRILRLGTNGVLRRADVEAALAAAGSRRARESFLALMLPELADQDGDGVVSEAEREAFLDATGVKGDTPIPESVQLEWLRRSEAIPPADRNAMTAGVILVTMNSALDSDASGRVTLEDLNALHRSLDANGDGIIDAGEMEAGTAGSFSATSWAVTDSMRQRPPVIAWQRSLEDALALSRSYQKPLLLCVNMDGENASESLAWGRYRDPAFAKLASGFIPLVASPDQHNLRARDDRGRRIPDPRFGRLIDAEHIDIEPILFERYFGGNRVAPRHVGVSPEGKILFDVYLVQDLSIVDAKLREFGNFETDLPEWGPESPEAALLASPDAAAREELERRFVAAEESVRGRLAAVALSPDRATQHPELVRLALRDPAAAVRRRGLERLIAMPDRAPVDQIPVAMALFGEDPELHREIVKAAAQMAVQAASQRERDDADFFKRAFEHLRTPSSRIDVARWKAALADAPAVSLPESSMDELDRVGEALEDLLARRKQAPDDLELLLEIAAGRARFAQVLLDTGGDPRFAFDDVLLACQEVLERAPGNARALGLGAWGSYMSLDPDKALELAKQALPGLVEHAASPFAAQVLELFVALRASALYAAIGAGESWEEDVVPDALAACEAWIAHPAATGASWRSYLDLLGALQAWGRQREVIRLGLEQMPVSTELHGYLRLQVLRDEGARALEAIYRQAPLASAHEEHGAALDWFHGLATLVAAEQDVLNRDPASALAAYARCQERFQDSIEAMPEYEASAAHYQALGLSGASRLLLEAGRLEDASARMLAALRRAPTSATFPDGLGNTPESTAGEIRRALVRAGRRDLAAELESALQAALEAGQEDGGDGDEEDGEDGEDEGGDRPTSG